MPTLLAEFDKAVKELRYRSSGVIKPRDDADEIAIMDLADKQNYQTIVSLLENIDRSKVTGVLIEAVNSFTRAAIDAANANAVEDRLDELQTVRPWRFVKKRRLMAKLSDYRQMENDDRRDAQLLLLAWARDCYYSQG